MFAWLNKQGVKSDKGFVVQSVGRFIIEYREASRTAKASVGWVKREARNPTFYFVSKIRFSNL